MAGRSSHHHIFQMLKVQHKVFNPILFILLLIYYGSNFTVYNQIIKFHCSLFIKVNAGTYTSVHLYRNKKCVKLYISMV